MASSCSLRRLDVMATLAVILAQAVADTDSHRLVTEYKTCSIMMFSRAPPATGSSCPARHYCHGGQSLCFPCSTCNGSDCRRMTYEPQCTQADPFTYQMAIGKPHYTPACSKASLLRASASRSSSSKATAVVRIESCEPGCDNLGINGSERCFSGTSCQLACGNDSVSTASWTALCNCSYVGNVATCDWVQIPDTCSSVDTQLPTATAKSRVPNRSTKEATGLKSMLGVASASDYAGDTSSPGLFDGRSRANVGLLDSLTKRTRTTQLPADIPGWVAAIFPIMGFLCIFAVALVIASRRDNRRILNISNIRNDRTYNYNIASIVGVPAMTDDTTDDRSESPSMTGGEPLLIAPFITAHGISEPLGNAASLDAALNEARSLLQAKPNG